MKNRLVAASLTIVLAFSGCAHYRSASLQDVEIPNYEPRIVAIPPTCEGLIQRVVAEGMARMAESETREVLFCQQQQIIRAQEEEAAAKRLESHAAAARFGLQMATFVITGVVAILAWVF